MSYKKYTSYGIIGVMSLSNIPALAKDDNSDKNRRFGIPDSITTNSSVPNTQLKLSMQRVNLPPDVWGDIEEMSSTLSAIQKNQLSAKEYHNLFERLNISYETRKKITESKEYKILFSLSEPHNIYAAQIGDYDTLLNNLISDGVLSSHAESALTHKIETSILANRQVRESLQNSLTSTRGDVAISNTDLETLISVLNNSQAQPLSCTVAAVCLAFVAVGVAIYAAAAVNAGAVLNIAAAISVAVSVAVTVSGGGGGGGGGGGNCMEACHNSIGRIEPKMIDQLSLIEAFARQENMPELHTKAVIDFKRKEARAVLNAVIRSGIINISDEDKDKAFEALDNIVVKSLNGDKNDL